MEEVRLIRTGNYQILQENLTYSRRMEYNAKDTQQCFMVSPNQQLIKPIGVIQKIVKCIDMTTPSHSPSIEV